MTEAGQGASDGGVSATSGGTEHEDIGGVGDERATGR